MEPPAAAPWASATVVAALASVAGAAFDGMGGNGPDDDAGGRRDAAPGKKCAQLFDAAGDALLGRAFLQAQGNADFPQVFVFKIPQQNRVALLVMQAQHGLVEDGRELFPV